MISVKPAVRIHSRISEIGREAWDACAGNPDYQANPFVAFHFLDALEESNCAVERAGWGPRHIAVEDETGRVAALMPLYLKSHSQGEYVFDHAWADAYERAGGSYYPKLLCASPFSPVTGPRMLVRPDVDAQAARRVLLGGALLVCERARASSLHVNFPTGEDWRFLGEQGLLQRQNLQYHWRNQGYSTFDDFLAALSSGRRKTIRRERRDAQAGLEILALTGADITEDHWDAFFAFYMDTGGRKWGRPYLNRLFFSLLGERMADQVLLIMARRGGRWIAGALNLMGADCLYGRNWGCVEDVPFLHFELCYYQAIEQAILRGLPRVEAGAQGEHKIARGYLPSPVYSAHWIADPALRDPVARFLAQERDRVQGEMEWLEEEYSPFRQGAAIRRKLDVAHRPESESKYERIVSPGFRMKSQNRFDLDEIGRLDTLLAEHIDHFHQSGVSAAQWRDYTAAMAEAPLLDPTLQLKSRYLLCIRDLRGRFVKLSQSWEANLDFRLSELQGAPLLRLVHPADVWATHDRMEAVRSGRGAGGFSNRYRRRSGGYRRLEWTSRLFGDLVYGVAHDVTELVGAEDL